MNCFNFEHWLENHSDSCEQNDTEKVYLHSDGTTSVLVTSLGVDAVLEEVDNDFLSAFYSTCSGMSIGDSQLTFATNINGGIAISHGFLLLDFEQMKARSRHLGIQMPSDEIVFLAEAAWMFVYTINDENIIKKYDRDFGVSREIPNISDVFESWWAITEM